MPCPKRGICVRGDVALSYALLTDRIGLEHLPPWRRSSGLRNFAESLLPMFQKTPLRVARLQLRLRTACCRSASWFLRTVQFPDQTRFDFGLRSNARFDVRVYFATKLADGWNTTYVFSGLFPFTRRSAP